MALAAHNVDSATAPVSRLKESVLGTFLDYLKDYTPATEALYLQAAKNFYSFLMSEEYASFNMAKIESIIKMRARKQGIRMPQFPADSLEKMITHYLPALDMTIAYDHNERLRYMRDRAFILTLADTGLRVHEICKLRRGDINWQEGQAMIIGKGDKQAMIRFSKRSTDSLKEYLDLRRKIDGSTGRPLASLPLFSRHDQGTGAKVVEITTTTGREIVKDRAIQALGEQAGITPHSFRHYFVTKVLRSTGNIKLAKELARHNNIQTTERYTHLTNDELDKGYYDVFEAK